jgi:hypothetical protein
MYLWSRSRYESKFILDSFIFWISPARFLRWLAAIINIFPRSRVFHVTFLGEIFKMPGRQHQHFSTVIFFFFVSIFGSYDARPL